MSNLLAVSGVYKSYPRRGQPVQVLSDLSVEVGPGEIVAAVGSPGAGKSSLLQVAAGMQLPDKGVVRLRDLDLTGLPRRAREQLLGREIAWTDRERPRLPWKIHDYVGLPLAVGRSRGCRKARVLAVAALDRSGSRAARGSVGRSSRTGSGCWSGLREESFVARS